MSRVLGMVLLAASVLFAADEEPPINMIPMDYLQLQYGGNMGMLSIGIGNRFLDGHYALEFQYGYTPRLVSEVTISTLAIRNSFIPATFTLLGQRIEPYAGVGWLYGFNQRYNPNWADEVPDDYYYQYAFHFSLYGGVCVMHPLADTSGGFSAAGFYVEVGSLDNYLVSYYSEPGALEADDIANISFGIRMAF